MSPRPIVGLTFLSTLLSLRDWVYLLSLLVPFAVYSFALKASTVVSTWAATRPTPLGPNLTIYLMQLEILFEVGYALLWIGLFAATKRVGPLRRVVIVLFHVITMLAVIVNTSAYQYFKTTGTTLDYGTIASWLPRLDEIMPILFQGGVPLAAWLLLFATLFYAALGPWLVTRFVGWWRGWPSMLTSGRPEKTSVLRSLILCLLALVFVSLSSLPAGYNVLSAWQPNEAWIFSRSLMKSPFVHVIQTAAQDVKREGLADVAGDTTVENPTAHASLVETSQTERRNVALILLESTRAQSVTPYDEDLETTPFLNELANSSVLAERAYTVIPYSSKANLAANCGIFPHPNDSMWGQIAESGPGGIPSRCLADLLKDQGYRTAYFMSGSPAMDDWPELVNNFGYEEFFPPESMDKEGFEEVNYPGSKGYYEDDIMLEPSEEWLNEHKDKPFLATYFTTTPHDAYVVPKRYGEESFVEDEELNRYLNTVRYQDFFLKNLFDQYRELGLYENTVFIILGDHGEAFGEHGKYKHGGDLYEESVRIPMLIHDPRRFEGGASVEAPVSQLDVLPTVADLLGYEIEGGAYQGSSLLGPIAEERNLMFSCLLDWCIGSLEGSEKYIHYYDDRPDELFDLSEDPLEKHNLADDRGQEARERRDELLVRRSTAEALYDGGLRREEE